MTRAEIEQAENLLRTILVAYVNKHCNPVPDWKPDSSIWGMLVQLDNALTSTSALEAENRTLRNAAVAADERAERFERRVQILAVVMEKCAEELAEWVEHYYKGMTQYPSEARRYKRDMGSVEEARAALKEEVSK